jgi:hypothetical protein
MTQAERDRLVCLKKAKKRLITQKQAAEEIGVSERQVRRSWRLRLLITIRVYACPARLPSTAAAGAMSNRCPSELMRAGH